MRLLCFALLLALAACASDEPADMTIEGVDPVQTDSDMAPDATLAPEPVAPPDETDLDAPGGTVEPDATLQPEAEGL